MGLLIGVAVAALTGWDSGLVALTGALLAETLLDIWWTLTKRSKNSLER